MLRIFVGATIVQNIPFTVLKHSIESRTTEECQIVSLGLWQDRIPTPRDPKCRPRTPFSFQRFLIPDLCKHRGMALYLDSDMLCLADIVELFQYGTDEADVAAPPPDHRCAQFAVMLIDCSRTKWNIQDIVNDLDAGEATYQDVMGLVNTRVAPIISPRWNELDDCNPDTKLIHYTDMRRQPWLTDKPHPHERLWFNELRKCVSMDTIQTAVKASHVHKRLLTAE